MDIKDLPKNLKKMMKKIVKEVTQGTKVDEAKDQLAKEMKDRTKSGYGVSTMGGNKRKLKKLAPSTKKQKKRQGKSIKSNLTHTGQMLDSMGNYNGKITVKGEENKDKAKYVSEERPFLNASGAEIKRFMERIQQIINDIIKRSR